MRTTVTRSTFAEAMALLGIGPDVGTVHIAEGSIIATTFTPNRDDAGAFLSTTTFASVVPDPEPPTMIDGAVIGA